MVQRRKKPEHAKGCRNTGIPTEREKNRIEGPTIHSNEVRKKMAIWESKRLEGVH